jgi:hypothetical protein
MLSDVWRFGMALEDGLVGWCLGEYVGLDLRRRCAVAARCSMRDFLCGDELDAVCGCGCG